MLNLIIFLFTFLPFSLEASAPIASWGRTRVLPENLKASMSDHFTRLAFGTGVIYKSGIFSPKGLGTAFYLGKFSGEHVMATNAHVIEGLGCDKIQMRRSKERWETFSCQRVIGKWREVDLALFTISVRPENEAHFKNITLNFDFDAPINHGAPLLMIGFGHKNNPELKQVFVQDNECMVASQNDEFQWITPGGPDNQMRVIAFAHGCDTSSGDSGSAIMERDTGRIIGIHSSGTEATARAVQTAADFKELFVRRGEDFWKRLNYAVPASMIKEKLLEFLEKHPGFKDEEIVREILNS